MNECFTLFISDSVSLPMSAIALSISVLFGKSLLTRILFLTIKYHGNCRHFPKPIKDINTLLALPSHSDILLFQKLSIQQGNTKI